MDGIQQIGCIYYFNPNTATSSWIWSKTIVKTIVEHVSKEKHNLVIIDTDNDTVEELIEKYDVMGVVGNGACLDIQEEAKIQNADLVIADMRQNRGVLLRKLLKVENYQKNAGKVTLNLKRKLNSQKERN